MLDYTELHQAIIAAGFDPEDKSLDWQCGSICTTGSRTITVYDNKGGFVCSAFVENVTEDDNACQA